MLDEIHNALCSQKSKALPLFHEFFCQRQHSRASVAMRHIHTNTSQACLFISMLFGVHIITGCWVNI